MSVIRQKHKSEYLFRVWGIAMHLVILWGVLDANFHSPVLRNLSPVPPVKEPPAKRLFLFVADGLRYKTFAKSTPNFLGNVMRSKGVWGISHTRVPTESRPGNVAIAAGLYEDPSALFKGWKKNPVDFDSTFNRSTKTWAWGSPDIVPMFVEGSHENVHGATYPNDWQDFDAKTNSPRRLDQWVFNEYDTWINVHGKSSKNQSGMLLFFHLLGCDTVGHASKPPSREYESQMTFVDAEIAEVMRKTEAFFGDNATAYIFTADHGMTDWGSHGGGSSDETETPIVAWGAGIARKNLQRDINQADITPFISTLLGISIPTNSEGILPRFFLEKSNEEFGLISVLNNIKQLQIQIKATRVQTMGDRPSVSQKHEQELAALIDTIEILLRNNQITEALNQTDNIIAMSKEMLYYYREFQRCQLITYLTLLWIGWIVLLVFKMTGTQRQTLITSNNGISYLTLANTVFCIAVILLITEHYALLEP
ncbi:GPI ethanolamine phosphate transferase 1 [Fopius arisanus]|uniref:GPI ethanolamine phosphate transferase 1 n=1 Tax=Fopius arisanus TaxID=64838 RepID=A0A9R1TPP0_9HYME|nr:PREDICTED: GPI ethanolamine phosphate transferase 1 [Fopius arisanus]